MCVCIAEQMKAEMDYIYVYIYRRTWEQVKPEIEMYFKKYDTNSSGKLV